MQKYTEGHDPQLISYINEQNIKSSCDMESWSTGEVVVSYQQIKTQKIVSCTVVEKHLNM